MDDMDEDDKAEGLLDVSDLVRMFEESEESTYSARKLAERDRDYVDNKQHTAEEEEALKKRGQPIVTDNRIKPKIDFMVGLEKQQRIDPKALPRTPQHENDADGATQALRYVTDTQDYDQKRSGVWRNMLVEGAGGLRVYVEPSKRSRQELMASTAMSAQEWDIKIDRVAWDRMFWDPHASEADFSDAGYLGVVLWADYDDAIAKYPYSREALESTMDGAPSDTYDDKPKFNLWADKRRKRVRICQIWVRRDDKWYFAEYTKGGILKAGPSPHVNDQGESDCELIFQSAFVDRDNNRYGYVREMISPQDETNKRRSKSLHYLNSSQVVYEDGAIDDIERFRRESVRPDGTMKVSPGALQNKSIQFNTRTDLADAHFKLLIEAQNSIDLKGPNATMLGEKAGGASAASGKAIIASQTGGMISLGDLVDNLRHLDMRAFRAVWNRIRQYWTAEKWIRVTDDRRNVKWVGLNVDPMQMQMAMQQSPEMAQKIAGMVSNVAELDCDIIIDEAPDNLTPQLEQFQALVELKKMDANGEIPFRALVEAVPNLKNRDKFLQLMDERQKAQESPEAQAAKQLQFRGAAADVADKEAAAKLKMAQAFKAMQPESGGVQIEQMEPYAEETAIADLRNTEADTALKLAQVRRTAVETDLAPRKIAEKAMIDRANLQSRASQTRQTA